MILCTGTFLFPPTRAPCFFSSGRNSALVRSPSIHFLVEAVIHSNPSILHDNETYKINTTKVWRSRLRLGRRAALIFVSAGVVFTAISKTNLSWSSRRLTPWRPRLQPDSRNRSSMFGWARRWWGTLFTIFDVYHPKKYPGSRKNSFWKQACVWASTVSWFRTHTAGRARQLYLPRDAEGLIFESANFTEAF